MQLIKELHHYLPINEQEISDKKAMSLMIEKFPDTILLRDNTIAHIAVSGFIVNQTYDKTLMIHHNIYQSWGWTGGHADGDSNLLQVAIKEAKEETGISQAAPLTNSLAGIDILPVFSHMKQGKFVNTHLHLCFSYLLLADESETLQYKPDENSGVKWLPFSQISNYCSEAHMIPVYEKLIQKVKYYANK